MRLLDKLLSSAAALAASVSFSLMPTSASAYQVDCAILLCLSGGWPASAPCAHARAVFIRRITPWPIEPPLQIWRCPMGVSYEYEQSEDPLERLFWAVQPGLAPKQSIPTVPIWTEAAQSTTHVKQPGTVRFGPYGKVEAGFSEEAQLHLAQAVGSGADIDIADPAFDFVRSIRVWDVRYFYHEERGRDDDCQLGHYLRLGTYGEQGQFSWRRASYTEAPSWVIPTTQCRSGNYRRGVGVEWTDFEAVHGHEWVSY